MPFLPPNQQRQSTEGKCPVIQSCPDCITDIKQKRMTYYVCPQVERMEVILLDLFSLNYVITSAVTLITSRFIVFHEIPWKHENSVETGKFFGLA